MAPSRRPRVRARGAARNGAGTGAPGCGTPPPPRAGPGGAPTPPPPYPGKAFYYRDHPDYAGEVDHADLIARLAAYDGWALSTSAAALPAVLALCPPGVRG